MVDIPAVVLAIDEEQAIEISVIENLQREDLNPVEETDAILSLLALRLAKTVPEVITAIRQLYDEARGRPGNNVISRNEREQIEQLFRMVGRFSLSSFYVNRLPLLQLPGEVLEAVRAGRLHYTKARRIARVADGIMRAKLLEQTIEDSLSVAEIDALIRTYRSRMETHGVAATLVREIKRSLTPGRLSRISIERQKELNELLARLKELLGR
jgi:ParB family chromosome partitioning protein